MSESLACQRERERIHIHYSTDANITLTGTFGGESECRLGMSNINRMHQMEGSHITCITRITYNHRPVRMFAHLFIYFLMNSVLKWFVNVAIYVTPL